MNNNERVALALGWERKLCRQSLIGLPEGEGVLSRVYLWFSKTASFATHVPDYEGNAYNSYQMWNWLINHKNVEYIKILGGVPITMQLSTRTSQLIDMNGPTLQFVLSRLVIAVKEMEET